MEDYGHYILGMCVDVTEMTRIKAAEAASQAKQSKPEVCDLFMLSSLAAVRQ